MDSLQNDNVENQTPEQAPEARVKSQAAAKKTIGGVAYVRDAYGCYIPASFLKERPKIRTPKDALPSLASIRYSPQEIVVVLDLDGNNQISNVRHVTIGLANQCQIHPRETFRGAILNCAVSILIAHNL